MIDSRRLRLATVAITATALLGLSACGKSEEPPTPTRTPSPFSPYVALGDSYSAVSGTETEFGDACLRSPGAYPNLLAEELDIDEFTTVACGGATSANLTSTQYPLGKGRNDPQLDALSSQTKLVTIGIGLNDEDYFLRTVAPCFLLNGREQSKCAPFLARPQSYFDNLVSQIGANVTEDLAAIKQAAPNARVVFVGYPRLLPNGRGCPSQVPLATRALERVRASGAAVNTTLKRVAQEAGVTYVDMYAASKGHDVCSKQAWVNGYRTVAGEAYYFHPFPAYHVAVAAKLSALLTDG